MKRYLSIPIEYEKPEFIDLYDEVPFWSAPFGLELLNQIIYRKNLTALDIGYGCGFPLTELAMRLGDTSRVFGLDPWTEAKERAEKKLRMYDIRNVKLIEGVAEEMPFADNTFDLIVSNNGLNNVEDLNKSLSECRRVANEKSQFIQTVNLNTSFFEFYKLLEEFLKEKELIKEIDSMNEHIYSKRKPLNELVSIISKNGFEVTSVTEHTFEYRFSDGSSMLNHYFIRLAFLDGWKSIVPEHRCEELFNELEIRMNRMSEVRGFFKLTVPFVVINSRTAI
jgi:ubiquinone/menaquinone biosynthesis C-methylase UbiE